MFRGDGRVVAALLAVVMAAVPQSPGSCQGPSIPVRGASIPVRWDVKQSGPLIVAGWDNWRLNGTQVPEISPANLSLLAEQQIVRVTALPACTILSPPYPGGFSIVPPTLAGGRQSPFPDFLNSLSPAQWARFTGKSGIGFEDMDGLQQEMFAACVPAQIRYVKYRHVAGKKELKELVGSTTLDSLSAPNVRLRLNRETEVRFKEAGKEKYGLMSGELYAEGAEECVVSSLTWSGAGDEKIEPVAVPAEGDGGLTGDFIKALANERPAPFSDGVYSVRDVCALISARLERPLMVDYRLGAEKLLVYGSSGLALSDLMSAVMRATSGVLRRVGPDFVLTTTTRGTGTLLAGVRDKTFVRLALYERLTGGVNQAIQEADIFWKADNVEKSFDAVDALLAVGAKRGQNVTPVNAERLPDAARDIVKGKMDSWRQSGRQIDPQTVGLSSRLVVSWVLPNEDVVPYKELDFLPYAGSLYGSGVTPEPPQPLASLKAPKALRLSFDVAVALAPLASEIKAQGIDAVWVNADTDTPAESLNAVFARFRQVGVKAYCVFPLFRSASAPGAPDTLTLNVAGQTVPGYIESLFGARTYKRLRPQFDSIGNGYVGWLSPSGGVRERRLSYLKTLSLDGVVLTDYRVPGYDLTGENADAEVSGFQLGYTAQNRRDFAAVAAADPVDLWKQNQNAFAAWSGVPGYIQENDSRRTELLREWRKFLYERNSAEISRAVNALRERPLSVVLPANGNLLDTGDWGGFVDCSAAEVLVFSRSGLHRGFAKSRAAYQVLYPAANTELMVTAGQEVGDASLLIDIQAFSRADALKWLKLPR